MCYWDFNQMYPDRDWAWGRPTELQKDRWGHTGTNFGQESLSHTNSCASGMENLSLSF